PWPCSARCSAATGRWSRRPSPASCARPAVWSPPTWPGTSSAACARSSTWNADPVAGKHSGGHARRSDERVPGHANSRGHGHSHGHGHGPAPEVAVGRLPRLVLLTLLAVVAVLTLAGAVRWWPDSHRVDELQGSMAFTAPGATYVSATVTKVEPRC